ncbi:MAG: AAA family ATPase, partial [Candidatus Riflebacteria bacterium]|nr:AAA family ATPase [Candidatus Riflebacteria bacterium]
MIQRLGYLEKLLNWKDKDVIKVITGMRRCGKSTLLKQFQQLLIEQKIEPGCILFINFEELENQDLLDYKNLYKYIIKSCNTKKRYYIFLDEIQNVINYEKAIDSLYVKGNFDIYITGSNSYLLSGELATLLSGRYIEISILPFSFKEYIDAKKIQNIDEAFSSYISY